MNNKRDGLLLNFRLQQIDMGRRGIFAGRKALHIVSPSAVRDYFNTATGSYSENKKVHVAKCQELNIYLDEKIPLDRRQHIADTVIQYLYFCAKKFPNLLKESYYAREQSEHNRHPSKRRKTS